MKFAQLEKVLALENANIGDKGTLDAALEEIQGMSDLDSELTGAMESARIASNDISTLLKMQAYAGVATESVALEHHARTLKNIAKRYSLGNIAQEGVIGGIAKAIAAVFKFFFDMVASIIKKIASLLGFGKKKSEGMAKLESSAKELSKEVVATISLAHGKFSPEGKDINSICRAYSSVYDSAKKFALASDKVLKNTIDHINAANSADTTADDISKIAAKMIADSIAILEGSMNKINTHGGHFLSYSTLNHGNFAYEVPSDKSSFTFMEDDPERTGEAKLTADNIRKLVALIKEQDISILFTDIRKDIDKLNEANKKSQDIIMKVKDADAGLKSAVSSIVKDQAKIISNIFRGVNFFIAFEANACSACSAAVKKASSPEKKTATESAEIYDHAALYIDGTAVYDGEGIESIQKEANNDFDMAMAAIDSGSNFVKTDEGDFSLEAFLVHVNNKYKHLGVSLEDDSVSPEVSPSEKTVEAVGKAPGSETHEDKQNEIKDDGTAWAKFKQMVKAILDFFVRLFKRIKEKIVGLFRRQKEERPKLEAKIDSNDKKIEEIKQAIRDREHVAEVKEAIKENPEAFSEEVKDYWNGKTIKVNYTCGGILTKAQIDAKYLEVMMGEVESNIETSKRIMEALYDCFSVLCVQAPIVASKDTASAALMAMSEGMAAASGEFFKVFDKIGRISYNDISKEHQDYFLFLKCGETYLAADDVDDPRKTMPGFKFIDSTLASQTGTVELDHKTYVAINARLRKMMDNTYEASADHAKLSEKINKDSLILEKQLLDYGRNNPENQAIARFITYSKNYVANYSTNMMKIAAYLSNSMSAVINIVTKLADEEARLANPKPQKSND